MEMEPKPKILSDEEIAKIQKENYDDQRKAVSLNNLDRFQGKTTGLENSSVVADEDLD